MLGNMDDHSCNHAMLYNFNSKIWRLSPAYDVLPINALKQHSIGIAEHGRVGDVLELVTEWLLYFKNNGVGAGDIERLKHVIPNLD